MQAIKITFGVWDEGALLGARVLPRAAVLTPHRLECANAPVGLQMHQVKTRPLGAALGHRTDISPCGQDVIGVSARMIATLWFTLPFGAIAARLSEALNAAPVFTATSFVSVSGRGRWRNGFEGGWWSTRGLVGVPDNDRAFLVMNEVEHTRTRSPPPSYNSRWSQESTHLPDLHPQNDRPGKRGCTLRHLSCSSSRLSLQPLLARRR